MKNYSSACKIARIVLTLICVILFVLQSYQQMDKFFSNMTSVSTSTMKDVAVRIPNIVVCLEEPFKAKKYPKSIEEFLDITYTVDEVFRNVPVDLQVASIATREGICYLLKRRQESDKTIFEISFKMTKDIKIYYVDKGQELCFIYGLFLCNVQLEASLVRGHGSDMIVTSKKFIHVPGTCISNESYSRYDCIEDYVDNRIEKEVSCIPPQEIHNKPNTSMTICSNMTLFQVTELKLYDIYYDGMTAKSGCKPSCEEWSYKAFQRSFTKENLQVASSLHIPDRYVYTHIKTSEIVVEEEYKIYDFNGIVGTVGGSLGLFVGFSFLHCMLCFLSSLHNKCRK